jgi:hypothetical protein
MTQIKNRLLEIGIPVKNTAKICAILSWNLCHQIRQVFYAYLLTSQCNYSYNAIRKTYRFWKTPFVSMSFVYDLQGVFY